MCDIITHHYFDIDAETVFTVCDEHIPQLKKTIQLTNRKAYKLLRDMEELNLIKVLKKSSSKKLSPLRGKMHTRMSGEEIDNQMRAIRKEWQRNIGCNI